MDRLTKCEDTFAGCATLLAGPAAAPAAAPSFLPRSSQVRRGTHSASLFTSSISFHPASSKRRTLLPCSFKFSKNKRSRGDPLSRTPFSVSSGRASASVGQARSALARSLPAFSSRRRGRQPVGNLNVASAPPPACPPAPNATSRWSTSRSTCASRNAAAASKPASGVHHRLVRVSERRRVQRPQSRRSSATGLKKPGARRGT